MSHSVLDSVALAVETPAGVVLVSGDFKIDARAPEEERTDLEALSAWGDRGVLALLSDSTNVEERGSTGAEDDLLPAFQEVFERTRGKVMVSCFATSIPRIQRVADLMAQFHVIPKREPSVPGQRLAELDVTPMLLPPPPPASWATSGK